MQGSSHIGFTLAGSMCLNSAVYHFFPSPLPNDWDYVLHAVGHPYTYYDLVFLWNHPLLLLTNETFVNAAHKLTFYLFMIWCADLPDRWERRAGGETETELTGHVTFAQTGKADPLRRHRGFTHSLLLWVLVTMMFAFCYMMAMRYLHTHGPLVPGWTIKEVCTLFLGLVVALFLHTVADMFTTRGVKVLWPHEKSYGIPKPIRFSNKSWGEYAVLWGTIFATGILFALGGVGF